MCPQFAGPATTRDVAKGMMMVCRRYGAHGVCVEGEMSRILIAGAGRPPLNLHH